MTQKDKIAVLQKHIDQLRKEVDSRISANNTIWRAVLAGLGALILLKQYLDIERFLFLLPALGMVLMAFWLNQHYTIFRAGAAMAEAETRINMIAEEVLLRYETDLLRTRNARIGAHRTAIMLAGVAVSLIYWFLEFQLLGISSVTEITWLRRIGFTGALIANLIAAANLWRFCGFFYSQKTYNSSKGQNKTNEMH